MRDARGRALAERKKPSPGSAGLGGRYYKTRKQVDAKAAQILTGPALV